MSGYTPGPWHIGREGEYQVDRWKRNCEWARIRGTNGGLIAKVESVHPKGERQSSDFDTERDNAALITAAPELLEALRKLSVWLVSPALDSATLKEMQDTARAAIAKAGQ